jgi:hypothetical protein
MRLSYRGKVWLTAIVLAGLFWWGVAQVVRALS